MKKFLFIISMLSGTVVLGQTTPAWYKTNPALITTTPPALTLSTNLLKTSTVPTTSKDSSIKITMRCNANNAKKEHVNIAYFINGRHYKEVDIQTLSPDNIESVTIKKESLTVGAIIYDAQIHIITKNNCDPVLLLSGENI